MGVKLLGGLCGILGIEAAQGVAEAADWGLEKLFGERVSEALAEAQQAMRAYAGPLPPNHDLERALRCAQLTSALIVLRAHAGWEEQERLLDRGADRGSLPHPFIPAARAWLHKALGLCPSLKAMGNEQVVASMEAALDEIMRSGVPVDEARSRSAALAQESWAELLDGAGGGAPPPEFQARFFGPAGWAAAFRALMQDALKKRPLVRDAFILSRLAALRDDSTALRPALDALAGDVGAMRAMLARTAEDAAAGRANSEELLRLGRQQMAELQAMRAEMAREAGVDPEKLRPIFEHLGHLGLSSVAIRARAEEAVAAILELARQAPAPSNDGRDIAATLGAARDKLGRLDTAGALATLSEKLAEEEAARRQRMLPLLAETAAIQRLTYDYEAAKATLRQLLDLASDDVSRWIELGDLHVTTGDLTAALTAFRATLFAAQRLDAGGRSEAAALDRIGDVQMAQGDLAAALASFQHSRTIAERLARDDPSHAGWQRDLSVSLNKIGDVQVAQGNLSAALASFQDSRAIAERLACADPAHAGWQRDLSVSLEKIGDVQMAQGDLSAALASFQDSRAIAERLACADPAHAGWQRDLAIALNKIGDVQVAQGDLSAALANFQASRPNADRLAGADPAHAGWQRYLSAAQEKLGDAWVREGCRAEAAESFVRALAICEAALRRNPGDIQARLASVVPLWRLGELRGAAGRAELEAALAILRPLAAADRLDHWRRQWIPAIEAVLARLGPPGP